MGKERHFLTWRQRRTRKCSGPHRLARKGTDGCDDCEFEQTVWQTRHATPAVEIAHLFAQPVDLLAQTFGLRFYLDRLRPVRCIQRVQVALDALPDLLLSPRNLVRCEVLVAAVHSLELATVNGDGCLREELKIPAYAHEASAYVADTCDGSGDEAGMRTQPATRPAQNRFLMRRLRKKRGRTLEGRISDAAWQFPVSTAFSAATIA